MRQYEPHRNDNMELPVPDDADDRRLSAFCSVVDDMLARRGVAERQRTRAIEHALGLSYNQARRLMTGKAPWSLEQLRRVAEHFNEPVVPLVAAFLHQPGKPASFPVGASAVPCTIWPTGEPVCGRSGALVALHDPASGRWTVATAAEVADRPSYAISALMFERHAPRRVAVLDDEIDAARAIADFLCAKDLDATAFSTGAELLAAMQSHHFDGFVVDWLLGATTAADVLASVRAAQPTVPVVILTGQLRTGAANEDELGAAASTYRALVLEKPTRMLSILNALQLGFGPAAIEA
jgi:CheY-like chemotaxis protein